ncbi:hypothetical protein OROMI_016392 [Orobanche minor]
MDEFYFERSHVPVFGSWQCHGVQEFTQCFESARQAGQLRCRYSEDHDLYVIGDLYDNDILTPAKIIVPRSREARVKTGNPKEREGKKDAQVECDYDCEVGRVGWAATKAVDEDLYKISPHLLRQNPKRKRMGYLFKLPAAPMCFLNGPGEAPHTRSLSWGFDREYTSSIRYVWILLRCACC